MFNSTNVLGFDDIYKKRNSNVKLKKTLKMCRYLGLLDKKRNLNNKNHFSEIQF